jgi:hypothetical protein
MPKTKLQIRNVAYLYVILTEFNTRKLLLVVVGEASHVSGRRSIDVDHERRTTVWQRNALKL